MFTSGEFAVAMPPEPLSVPDPIDTPTFVGPSQVAVLPTANEQRKKSTLPVGVLVGWLPLTVATSWTAVPGETEPEDGAVVMVAGSAGTTRPRSPSGPSPWTALRGTPG